MRCMTGSAATTKSMLHTLLTAVGLICCLSGLILQSSCVLCVGDNGHLEIEALVRACCTQLAAPRMPIGAYTTQIDAANDNNDQCGGCVDFPLSSTLALKSQTSVRNIPPHFASQTLVVFALPASGIACNAVQPSPPPAELSHSRLALRSLRATVIRI